MNKKKRKHSTVKPRLHPRNKNRERYKFQELIETCPELAPFVVKNKFGDESIEFADPEAVKVLNKALLIHFYGIKDWKIPKDYMVPPIPGRADYIHHLSDLFRNNNYGNIPTGPSVKCLDIGTGSSCIYPIIGNKEYGWSFIASDIDTRSIESCRKILAANSPLDQFVDLRSQKDPNDYFYGILKRDEVIDASICNPPFHASAYEAASESLRKLNNLQEDKTKEVVRNFGGKSNELWCKGGEERFIGNMIRQSRKFGSNCFWFTSLVSKQSNLKKFERILRELKATRTEIIIMGQGNKSSRMLAWSFLTAEQQKHWRNTRWKQ